MKKVNRVSQVIVFMGLLDFMDSTIIQIRLYELIVVIVFTSGDLKLIELNSFPADRPSGKQYGGDVDEVEEHESICLPSVDDALLDNDEDKHDGNDEKAQVSEEGVTGYLERPNDRH